MNLYRSLGLDAPQIASLLELEVNIVKAIIDKETAS